MSGVFVQVVVDEAFDFTRRQPWMLGRLDFHALEELLFALRSSLYPWHDPSSLLPEVQRPLVAEIPLEVVFTA